MRTGGYNSLPIAYRAVCQSVFPSHLLTNRHKLLDRTFDSATQRALEFQQDIMTGSTSPGVMGSDTVIKLARRGVVLKQSKLLQKANEPFRLLQWNILADGLAQHGDFIYVSGISGAREHRTCEPGRKSLSLLVACRPSKPYWSGITGFLWLLPSSGKRTQT